MAKRGGTKHQKRIALPKAMPIFNKKAKIWLSNTAPGPHNGKKSVPLGVYLRDVIKLSATASEIKRILHQRLVTVDGKVRTSFKFPVGFMDIIHIAKMGKSYRVNIDNKGRLMSKEVQGEEAKAKILKVTKKISNKGKIMIGTHDGRNLPGDNKVRVGDSVLVSIPEFGIKRVLKLENDSHCIVTDGKHAGKVSVLKEIINRKEGRKPEARLVSGKEEFITVAAYLFVVDDKFKV